MNFNKKYYMKLKRILKYSASNGGSNRFWVNGESVYYTNSNDDRNFTINFMFFKEPTYKFAAALESDEILSDDLRSRNIENMLEDKVKICDGFALFSEYEVTKLLQRNDNGYSKTYYNGIEFPTLAFYYLFDLFDIKSKKKNCVYELDEKEKIITIKCPNGLMMIKSV